MSFSSGEEGMFSWMEDSLQQFDDDLEHTLQFSEPDVRTFSKSFEDDSNSLKGNQPDCALVTETKALRKDCDPQTELFGSPEPLTEGDDYDEELTPNLKWEDELSQIIEASDREVPMMDEKTKEELVTVPVKEFNIRIKSMKLDAKVLQHLKLCRKRLKNRQAAIRSRSKKENETLFLQKRVDQLVREKEQQQILIKQLQQRLTEIEKKAS